jgi:hypothetical protein
MAGAGPDLGVVVLERIEANLGLKAASGRTSSRALSRGGAAVAASTVVSQVPVP